MKLRFKRLRKDDGQALVELAFVLPLLLLFLFGIIDFGMALNQYNTNTNLANIAVREVAIIGDSSSVACGGSNYDNLLDWIKCEAKVTGEAIPQSACVADTTNGSSSPSAAYNAGDPVKVEISSTFNWFSILSSGSGFIGSVVKPSSNITASATMRMEQAPSKTTISSNGYSGYTNTFLSNSTLCSS